MSTTGMQLIPKLYGAFKYIGERFELEFVDALNGEKFKSSDGQLEIGKKKNFKYFCLCVEFF